MRRTTGVKRLAAGVGTGSDGTQFEPNIRPKEVAPEHRDREHRCPLVRGAPRWVAPRYRASVRRGLPAGTVTFLFTNIADSTRRWEEDPTAMAEALRVHDAIVRSTIERHGGYIFDTGGDGIRAAFSTPAGAAAAAIESQEHLRDDGAIGFTVRMALHTAEATERDGSYSGNEVNRAARAAVARPRRPGARLGRDRGAATQSRRAATPGREPAPRSARPDVGAPAHGRRAPGRLPGASRR